MVLISLCFEFIAIQFVSESLGQTPNATSLSSITMGTEFKDDFSTAAIWDDNLCVFTDSQVSGYRWVHSLQNTASGWKIID